MPNSNIHQLIREALNEAYKVLVITHIGPDGDAIGSLTAMGLMLQKLEKCATLVSEDGIPKRFRYLPLTDSVVNKPPGDEKYDLIITLDAGDMTRIGKALINFQDHLPPLINIDHHVTNTCYGEINLVDTEACSTTEILFKLSAELDIPLNTSLAECLLTGLVTDTLNFRTANVTGRTLKTAGMLVDAGLNLHEITTQALTLKEMATVLIWKKGLNNARVEDGIFWTALSDEDQKEVGYQGYTSNGLANLLTDVYDIKMSAVFMELPDGRVTISFRCRPPYSVSELAESLGGGGHHLASGCTLKGSLEEVTSLVISRSKEVIQQQTIELQQEGS